MAANRQGFMRTTGKILNLDRPSRAISKICGFCTAQLNNGRDECHKCGTTNPGLKAPRKKQGKAVKDA